ncbi:Ser/Thr protein phosphatase [Mycobacteroides abscessus subsp. abscessus]|nr:Ser/Thr protein phosphatase [Mycobacteroides abscessus subsp. abscessus]
MSPPDSPLAIVADVHGEADALSAALAHYGDRRHIVLVGDYVNRGPNSAEVLTIVAEVVGRGEATALMGNHDYAFLEYLRSGQLGPFARLGGLATLNSYIDTADDPHEALTTTIPRSHLELLEGLRTSFETEDILVSHCGLPPLRPHSRSLEDLVLGSHPELFGPEADTLPKTVVCGHYVQRGSAPFVSDNFICIDTGCGTIAGHPLTVLELPERKFRYFECPDRKASY